MSHFHTCMGSTPYGVSFTGNMTTFPYMYGIDIESACSVWNPHFRHIYVIDPYA